MNSERDESKTNENCVWNDPTKAGKKKYPKGLELEKIADIQDKHKCPTVSFDSPSAEERNKQLEIMEAVGNTESPVYKLLKLKFKKPPPKPEPKLPDWVKDEMFTPFLLPPEYHLQPIGERERIYYEENLLCCKDKSFELCRLTIHQGKCKLWHDERGPRITGSTGSKIEHATSADNRLKYFTEDKDLDEIPAIKYGREEEPNALNKFARVYCHYEVTKLGMVVPINYGFFGASPDAILRDKSGQRPGWGVLEIKCLYSYKNQKIGKVDCLDKTLKRLKKGHCYYTQIQLTMWVTQAKYGFLFLYSGVDYKLIPVPYSESFV